MEWVWTITDFLMDGMGMKYHWLTNVCPIDRLYLRWVPSHSLGHTWTAECMTHFRQYSLAFSLSFTVIVKLDISFMIIMISITTIWINNFWGKNTNNFCSNSFIIQPALINSFVSRVPRDSTPWFFCLSVRPSVRPSVRSSVRPSVHSSVRPSVRPFVRPSIRPSVRPSFGPYCLDLAEFGSE